MKLAESNKHILPLICMYLFSTGLPIERTKKHQKTNKLKECDAADCCCTPPFPSASFSSTDRHSNTTTRNATAIILCILFAESWYSTVVLSHFGRGLIIVKNKLNTHLKNRTNDLLIWNANKSD